MPTTRITLSTLAEARAFARGVEYANDSALTVESVTGSTVVIQDDDAEHDEDLDYTHVSTDTSLDA